LVDNKELSDIFDKHLRTQTFPLAIKMLAEDDEIPGRTKIPFKDLNARIAVCQGFAISRKYGWALAISRDDISCPLTKIAFGFDKEPEFYTEGNLCCDMYTETKEAGAITESEVAKFPYEKYKSILVSPVSRASFQPDVILIYGNSAQVMILVTAFLYKSGGYLSSKFSGRLDCSDSVIRTMQTDECQVVLPCYGDRIFGQTEDYEMAFTIPASKIEQVVEGLQGTHKGGVRYPIPSFLRYQGQYPPKYEELNDMLLISNYQKGFPTNFNLFSSIPMREQKCENGNFSNHSTVALQRESKVS